MDELQVEKVELSSCSDEKNKNDHYIENEAITYESAISLVGFGKYNYYLLLLCMPTCVACLFATSSVSYVLSQAQCDLELTLEHKGLLNAIPYVGMITSGLMWGTFADNYGRRIVIIFSLALDAICSITASLSRSFWVLLLAKYFSGFMICGSLAIQLTFMCEFHHFTFRPKLITINGVYFGVAKILLPLLAWVILPSNIHFIIIPQIIEYRSWQLYILVCTTPAICGTIIHIFLPESPKFLMTKGRYQEAMKIFHKMYITNTGNRLSTLPFCRLIDRSYEEKKTRVINNRKNSLQAKKSQIIHLWEEVKPLFYTPYLQKLTIGGCINFGSLLGSVTLRLWLPQLLATMDEYVQTHNTTENTTLCDMLSYKPKKHHLSSNATVSCIVPELSTETYLNNIIVPIFAITLYFIVGFTVNRIGKKNILTSLSIMGAIIIMCNYFSKSSITTVLLSAMFLASVSVNSMVCLSISVELFPTSLRAKAIALIVVFGRFGPLVGNISFPYLLYAGCLVPFIFISCFEIMCFILSICLPNTERKSLA